jgi:ferredoxin
MDEPELSEKLEEMAQDGLIFRVRDKDKRLYHAEQFIIGIYEYQIKNKDKEFYELFEEYIPYLGMNLATVQTKQMRYIPMESAIASETEIATYDRVRELIMEQDIISVEQCICKQEQNFLNNTCQKPQEVCFGFGDFAHYFIDNKMGREIGKDEAFKILEEAEKAGLVLGVPNAQELSLLCCCCSCCCPNLRFSKLTPRPADMVLSYHQAKIAPDLCTACGICQEKCQMDAIEVDDDIAEIVDGRCIGCGLCVSHCPEDALSLEEKPGMEPPPKDFKEIFDRIAAERGL